MRVMSVVKIAVLASAVALVSSTSFAKMKLPPGACAVGKKGVLAASAMCSHECNPTTMWCSQEMCVNGALTHIVPCFGSFCTAKCAD